MRTRQSTLIAAVIVLAAVALTACQEALYTNLPEREANLMIATLEGDGIQASRVAQPDGQMTITVDKGRFAQAVQVLDAAGLPKTEFASMGKIFERSGLVASPMQERAQMIYALSEELSRTVSEIDGVLSARVHVVLPDNDVLRRGASPSAASVFVRYEPGLDINPLIPQIKTLVANGIAGLAYDKVSVVAVAAPTRQSNPAAQQPKLVSVFGVWMLPESATLAKWIIGGLGFLVLLFGAVIAVLLMRQRRRATYEVALAE